MTPTVTLLIGPSGAGKTTWLDSPEAKFLGIKPEHVISSDKIREELCGDFQNQSKNKQVFEILHDRLGMDVYTGLNVVIDATNITRKSRMGIHKWVPTHVPVRYVVINRPMEEKYRDGGWRNRLDFDLIAKHEQTFQSQLSDIMNGDGLPNVTVYVGGKIDTSGKTDTISGTKA